MDKPPSRFPHGDYDDWEAEEYIAREEGADGPPSALGGDMDRTTITVSKTTHKELSEINPGLTWNTFLLVLLEAWVDISAEIQMNIIKYTVEHRKEEEPCSQPSQ